MINIQLSNPSCTKPTSDEVACYRVPSTTPIKLLTEFFESLGFVLSYKPNSDDPFLEIKDYKDRVRGRILVSGTHSNFEVVK